MYKYLSITQDLQEMMIMLKSLPACTLVFDEKNRLVDMNIQAMKLLKINDISEIQGQECKLFIMSNYLKNIIRELKKGTLIHHAKMTVKCSDNSMVFVDFSACMLNGAEDLFIFQLFEIPFLNKQDKMLAGNIGYENIVDNLFQSTDLQRNSESGLALINRNKDKYTVNPISTRDESIQSKLKRRNELSQSEVMICQLIASNMSIQEIADTIGKTVGAVYTVIRRIVEKRRLKSKEELYQQLLE